MAGVEIVEVGPRDGLQNEKVLLPTEVKVDYITRALDAGIHRMEAVAFVHPARVPQLAALAGTGTWIGERLGIATPALLGRTATFPPATR
jgi:hydroxymethylglutaryl-CoA lyase